MPFPLPATIKAIVRDVATPFYLYAAGTVRARAMAFQDALKAAHIPFQICYAIKANGNMALLTQLAQLGLGGDVLSAGELARAVRAGMAPIVFSGVGKTIEELHTALKTPGVQINVESLQELQDLKTLSDQSGLEARVALRLNPGIAPDTHAHIATSGVHTKFGLEAADIPAALAILESAPRMRFQGLAVHVGSQITQLEDFEHNFLWLQARVRELHALGHTCPCVDVGGGLGIPYDSQQDTVDLDAYARRCAELFPDTTLIFEPGRWITGPAGWLVTSVIRTKAAAHTADFAIVDAAMNDFLRPMLYQARHGVRHLERSGEHPYTIVGPICESTDRFHADPYLLPVLEAGDVLVVENAGAYGAVMASQYNARALIPEVIYEDGASGEMWYVARERTLLEPELERTHP